MVTFTEASSEYLEVKELQLLLVYYSNSIGSQLKKR